MLDAGVIDEDVDFERTGQRPGVREVDLPRFAAQFGSKG